ncbi:MAG: CehA/McbA family metallohydrolase [Proteobacteria bacterium]|nr:CehA/McbA family metallohydrolase [Pseudomonadota bacterium]
MHSIFLVAGLTTVTGLLLTTGVLADRETVLKQIDVPHNYYYREMYLPQLTSGPSSLTWSPDGSSLIYSMQGSLWRQYIGSGVAEQLTASPGYDYQPDWSPDGTHIAFVRYQNDAVELHMLDLSTGTTTALTNEGAVNLEPRWSPDGSRLAFVSTRDEGRFHVFTGAVVEDVFSASRLTEERKSDVTRYYYSAFDHEISPTWSPDGKQLLYISNPEIPYGTGAIWRRSIESDAEPQLVRMEETSWRTRPDWSPDGKRVAYASYLGRQWHQLWITTTEGNAEPFPLTYGDFDVTSPRWSPDGKQIAYVANESGTLEIRIQEMVGGKTMRLDIAERRFINPVASLLLNIVDENGQSIAARVAVVASNGRSYAPDDTWLHADDAFDRSQSEFETQYFHLDGETALTLPTGLTNITVWRGMEHQIKRIAISLSAEQDYALTVELQALDTPQNWKDWVSGDVHVHMNYGGTYRNTPTRLARQADAEDLDVVFNLIVNKEQRVPDIRYFSTVPDAVSNDDILIMHAQEFHTSFWGHLGIIGLKSHLLLPDYSAYPGTGAASIFPDNATILRLAHEQDAAVGYVHPFDPPAPNPATDASLTNAFPVDVALGLVDYYEVVGFSDSRTSADVWYGLLNCGMRVTAAGGTDAMANYASLRGPVGISRTYVHVPGLSADPVKRQDQWLDALKAGNTMATNGPIVGLTINGHGPGGEIMLQAGSHELSFDGFLRSIVPVDHFELVMNGEVIRSFELDDSKTSVDFSGNVQVERSGWLLLRAWNEGAHPLVFDAYPYATTTPVYLSVGNETPRSTADADYFIAWIERIRESVEAHSDFNNDGERDLILTNLNAAQQQFEACR